jgi:hypothetical protein
VDDLNSQYLSVSVPHCLLLLPPSAAVVRVTKEPLSQPTTIAPTVERRAPQEKAEKKMDSWKSDEMATSLAMYSLQQEQEQPTPSAPEASATAAAEEESKKEKKEKKEKKTKEAKVKKEAKVAKEADDKPKKAKKEKAPEVKYVDETPPGMKKILTAEFPATYQPAYVESAWQSWWEKSGFYQPDLAKAKAANEDMKFVMVIPPPNVTGSLHLGHALTSTIEDTLTRWYRMKGYVALWVPGVDHAGIATQSVVEKRLQKVPPAPADPSHAILFSPCSLSLSVRGHHETRLGSRAVHLEGLGVEGDLRQPHLRAGTALGRLCRLVPRDLHDG